MLRINNMKRLKNMAEYDKIKDKIAFVFYGNLNYEQIINSLSLGNWLKYDNKKIKIYILNKKIHTIIPDELLNESIDEVALILIDDIIKNIKINKDFRVIYDDYADANIETSKKIKMYGRVERIWEEEAFNDIPYSLIIENKTNLQINDDFIQLLNRFEHIGVKHDYEHKFIHSLSFTHKNKECFRKYEGYQIDILKTNFNSVEELKDVLNITYDNCQINTEMLSLIDIKDKIEIILKVFASGSDLNDLSMQDKDFIKNGICKLENFLGNFINMYEIKDDMTDSQIPAFYINLGQYCIIFQNYTLVISYGSDE